MIDREEFFKGYRQHFERKLKQRKVDALDFLLDRFEARWSDISPSTTITTNQSINSIAYMLATAYHETSGLMEPRKEVRQTIYGFGEARQRRIKFRKHQDRYWLSGYFGRGYVQITWLENYKKFSISNNPDDALHPEVAFNIMLRGMSKGLFTGRKLSDYFTNRHTDFLRARKIINGMDQAGKVADYAMKFREILLKSLS